MSQPNKQPTWNPGQYLKFAGQRMRPALDLLNQVDVEAPSVVYDLGCGPGNVTPFLMGRWPDARHVGVDSSDQMLEKARAEHPTGEWVKADAKTWTPEAPAELIYSNAALQWVDGHADLFPRLMDQLAPGGSRIIGYSVRSALGVLTWGLDMQSAIDLPHVMNRGGVTSVAQELAGEIPALTEMGHRVEVNRMISGLQGIKKVPGGLTGGADKRREGVVLGDAGDDGRADFGAGNAYVCNNGSVLTLAWAKVGDDDFVRWREDGETRTLARVISGSGARYSDGLAEVWEHQGEVRVTGRGGVTRTCRKAL
jgi:SAM-dependent methyltransferase